MPAWKSLLDIDRLVEAWRSPDTAAPQRMTLLRHVADLAAAIDPADREGEENAIPVVVKGAEKKPQAMPMTWVGQKDEGRDGREAGSAEIPPRPDYGAKDVTVDEIKGLLKSDGRNRQWDNATLRAWAELARQDPEKAKAMLDEVRDAPVRTADGGVSIPLPPRDGRAKGASPEAVAEIRESLMTGKDWAAEARRAATAKILPEGGLTVEVNSTAPQEGPALPPGSVRVSGKAMTPDGMLATLRGIAPNIGHRTDQEREFAISMAYRLERLREADPEAYGKLPGEVRKFLEFFKERMDIERAGIKPKNPGEETIELPAEDWKEMVKTSADDALRRSVRQFSTRMAIRGAANLPADIAELVNKIPKSEWVNQKAEGYKNWTRRAIPVPAEYEGDPGLQAAEFVGGKGGKRLVTGGARRLKSLLNIFK